jgi:hypothetical protein
MTITDLRQPVERHIFNHETRTINRSIVGDVERLFDREGTAQDLLDLLDKKLLQGREVITYKPRIAVPANVKITTTPSWTLSTLIGEQMVDPTFKVNIRYGWDDIDILPQTDRTIFLPGTNLNEVRIRQLTTLANSDSMIPHQVWIDGKNYEIETILSADEYGSQVRLVEPIEGAIPRRRVGSIHPGATSVRYRLRGKNGVVMKHDTWGYDFEPQQGVSFDVVEGEYTLEMTLVSPKETRTVSYAVRVSSPTWDDPFKVPLESFFVLYTPPIFLGQPNNFNRIEHSLGIKCSFGKRPADTPPLIGMFYRTITVTEEGSTKGPEMRLWFDQMTLDAQESGGVDTAIVNIPDVLPNFYRVVEGSFVDAMGREVAPFSLAIDAEVSQVTVHSKTLKEDFGNFVKLCAEPLSINPAELGSQVSAEIDRMKSYAESVVSAHATTDISYDSE